MSTVAEPKQVSLANRMEMPTDLREAGSISVSDNGLVLTSMNQAIEFAKLMARMGEAIPKHLRDKAGPCLAICIQAFEWRISPLALANKCYVVNDRLCYEAALYQSVVARRAPILGRIKMEYDGEGNGRICRVWAELADGTGTVDYTSPKFGSINPKNSPLWKNDPDQQLFYFSVRGFARRHFNDVMMGIYTVDEMIDSCDPVRTVESRSKVERLTERLVPVAEAHSDTDAAYQPDSFFAPQSTDDRRQMESATNKSQSKQQEAQQQQEENPEPDSRVAQYQQQIKLAEAPADLDFIEQTAKQERKDKKLDNFEFGQIDVMLKEARERVKPTAREPGDDQ